MLPGEPKPATAEAQALLRAAERDRKTVELLLQHPDAPVSSVCFHAQQFINSPYTEPSRHWRYERETRAFSLAEGRRPAGNVVLYVKKQPAFFESKFVIQIYCKQGKM
jgi:hypothetical protein